MGNNVCIALILRPFFAKFKQRVCLLSFNVFIFSLSIYFLLILMQWTKFSFLSVMFLWFSKKLTILQLHSMDEPTKSLFVIKIHWIGIETDKKGGGNFLLNHKCCTNWDRTKSFCIFICICHCNKTKRSSLFEGDKGFNCNV